MNVQPNTWLKLFSSLNYGDKPNLVDQISLYYVHLYKTVIVIHRFMKHKYSITVRTFILLLKIKNRATKSHRTNWLNRKSLEHSHCMPNFANLRIFTVMALYIYQTLFMPKLTP